MGRERGRRIKEKQIITSKERSQAEKSRGKERRGVQERRIL